MKRIITISLCIAALLSCRLAEQKSAVYAATFSPDAKRVAAGGFDGTVRLFELPTGKLIKSFSAAPLTARQ